MRSYLTLRLEEETPEPPATPEASTTPPLRPPRRKPEPLPPLEEVRRVLEEKSGASYSSLRKALPVSRWTLNKLHAELEMPLPPSTKVRLHVPRERLEQMIALKMPCTHMARELGISGRGLMSVLARHGLKPFDPFAEKRELGAQGLRRCCDCHQIKSLELDFSFMKRDILGRNYRCKLCATASSLRSHAQKRAARRSPP